MNSVLAIGVNMVVVLISVGGVVLKFTERISRLEAHQDDMAKHREEMKSALKDLSDRVPPREYWTDLMQRVRHLEERNK